MRHCGAVGTQEATPRYPSASSGLISVHSLRPCISAALKSIYFWIRSSTFRTKPPTTTDPPATAHSIHAANGSSIFILLSGFIPSHTSSAESIPSVFLHIKDKSKIQFDLLENIDIYVSKNQTKGNLLWNGSIIIISFISGR